MSQITLSQFRRALLDQHEERAPEARRRIYVDRSGRIVVGDDVGDGDRRQLSEVHPAVFA
ncbi:MAG TPA: hypothetical protein VFK85_06265 [Anaeromyxobacteraceae bacterium]|nr:hypothetical protein [Anaeromyxobacteraceae bacterium]